MLAQIAIDHPGKRIETYFQDEAQFGQQGTLSRGWAKRAERFTAVRQTKYDWLYVIGVACPRTGHAVEMLSPYINVEVMNIFPWDGEYPPGTLCQGNFRWHSCSDGPGPGRLSHGQRIEDSPEHHHCSLASLYRRQLINALARDKRAARSEGAVFTRRRLGRSGAQSHLSSKMMGAMFSPVTK